MYFFNIVIPLKGDSYKLSLLFAIAIRVKKIDQYCDRFMVSKTDTKNDSKRLRATTFVTNNFTGNNREKV